MNGTNWIYSEALIQSHERQFWVASTHSSNLFICLSTAKSGHLGTSSIYSHTASAAVGLLRLVKMN